MHLFTPRFKHGPLISFQATGARGPSGKYLVQAPLTLLDGCAQLLDQLRMRSATYQLIVLNPRCYRMPPQRWGQEV
jgi:hypothetical protein